MSYNPNNPNGQNTMANSAPVTIASNQTAVPVSATTLPLPTGAATETTLASIKDTAGIKKITDALPAGTNLLGKVGIDQTTPGTTNLVSLSAETTKVIGTVTANAGTGTSAVDVQKVGGVTVSTGSGTNGTGVQRVNLATDQAALTTAGLISVKIDQTTPGTTNLVAANITQLAGTATAVGVGASSAGTARVVQANDSGKTIQSKAGTASSSGDNTIISAGTNKLKIKAFSLTTTSTSSVTCIFKSGATVLWQVVLQAPTGVSVGANLVVPAPDYIFSTASATLLNLNLSAAQTIHYSVSYYDEA